MPDDWRVTVTVAESGHTGPLLRSLHEREVRNDLKDALSGRVAVSSDGPTIFLYAETRRAAEAAEEVLRETLEEHGFEGEPQLDHWHPIEERWEDARVPLPVDAEGRDLEEERREDDEEEAGVADWEVRIELEDHGDAVALGERLEGQGLTVTRRWTYLLVGAATRDEAEELAARIREEAPHGAQIQVEPGLAVVWELKPKNPFAIFGGLAG